MAQNKELECWTSNDYKITTPEYREAKKDLWRKVLGRVGISQSELDDGNILEFGCGPAGLFMLFPDSQRYVAVDPLASEYKNHFDYLRPMSVSFVNSKIEGLYIDRKFSHIFGFNALDHVDDIHLTVDKLRRLCQADHSSVVLSVNIHNYSFIQRILAAGNVFLDPLHKHQYTVSQYKEIFTAFDFEILNEGSLDAELKEFEDKLKGSGSVGPNSKKAFNIRSYLHPGKLFFGILKKLGMPRYGHDIGSSKRQSVYSLFYFTLRPVKKSARPHRTNGK